MTGTIIVTPPPIELPSGDTSGGTQTLPPYIVTYAIAYFPQTWTGLQTFINGSMRFAGSISGFTLLNASPVASGVLTLPSGGGTLATETSLLNLVAGPASATDKGVTRYNGTTGKLIQNSLVTVDDNGKVFVPDFSSAVDLTGTLVVGTGGLNNSLRSAYQIRRTLSDAGISFHGFSDNTFFNGVTNAGYGSFDSRVNFGGSLPNDHFNSVQSLLNYNNSAIMHTHQGFVWAPQVNNGQVESMYAMHLQAPLITAPGVKPLNLVGLSIDDLTGSAGAGLCRAVLTTGTTASEFGGFLITEGGFIARNPGESMLFQSALAATEGSLAHNGTRLTLSNFLNNSIFLSINSTDVIETSATFNRPVTDNTINSGGLANRWAGVFAGAAVLNKNAATTLPAVGAFAPMLDIAQADAVQTVMTIRSFNNGSAFLQPSMFFVKSRGTGGAPGAVQSGDLCGATFAYGYNSSLAAVATAAGAGSVMTATETYSGATSGMRLGLFATPVGGTTASEKVSIGAGLSVGSTTDPGAGKISATNAIRPGSFTVAALPAGVTGDMVHSSNVRVFNGAGVQEGAAAGTGGLVSYNGTAWKIAGTNVTAVA